MDENRNSECLEMFSLFPAFPGFRGKKSGKSHATKQNMTGGLGLGWVELFNFAKQGRNISRVVQLVAAHAVGPKRRSACCAHAHSSD